MEKWVLLILKNSNLGQQFPADPQLPESPENGKLLREKGKREGIGGRRERKRNGGEEKEEGEKKRD